MSVTLMKMVVRDVYSPKEGGGWVYLYPCLGWWSGMSIPLMKVVVGIQECLYPR